MSTVSNTLNALLAALALALLSAAVPAVAQAADGDGWRRCADEGQTCRVQGRATVRYGTEGRWTTRSVIDGIQCGNEAFGDPAPDVPKRCEARTGAGGGGGSGGAAGGGGSGSGAAGWTYCAAEGQTCRFRGQAQVRFGQGDRFNVRTAYGSVRCDVDDFGDPIFGVTKFCEVRSSAALDAGGGSSGSWSGPTSGWRYCAAEGGSCKVNGRAQVRFGDGRRYNTRSVNGEIACSTDVFGDPAFGVVKHCEVQATGANGAGFSAGWTRCARENERCSFSGAAQVRYGTAGRYVYRDARDGLQCSTDSFGSDPYDGRVKQCEIRR